MHTFHRSPALFLLWGLMVGLVSSSCVENQTQQMLTVSHGMRQAHSPSPTQPKESPEIGEPQDDVRKNDSHGNGGEVMVMVNSQAVTRHRLIDLLLRSYGPELLEQIVVLERAQLACARRGIVVVQRDFDDEYNRMLRQMVDPLSSSSTAAFPHEKSEQMLDTILQQSNISREVYMIGVHRNAYMRKLVTADSHYSNEQLHAEYDRAFGRRFVVRHIQLASPAEASRAMDQLSAGVDFQTVAKRYSANRISAEAGGLLDPFSVQNDDVPQVMRDVTARLSVGEVSQPTRIGRWHQIIRLESVIEAESVGFPKKHDQLVQRLQDRKSPEAMGKLYESLLAGARVEILDDTLRAAWERKQGASNP